MSGEKLYNLRAHPAVEPLNKEQAWEKLQELRNSHKKPVNKRRTKTALIWYSILTTAACLFLFIRINTTSQQPLEEKFISTVPAKKEIKSEPPPVKLNPEKPTEIRPIAKTSPKKSVTDPVPEASQLKQEKLPVIELPSPVIHLDSITNQHKSIPLTTVSEKAAKRVFHLNELRDPDLPYTINQEKKPARPPVAKQQLEFSIKINLSN
jgi:hypothetical protein